MLFVVATPIGNLEDVTLRALRVLREADVIAAEDTRRTARLLAHHGIATATVSFHEHNSKARIPQLLARLQAGERVALVGEGLGEHIPKGYIYFAMAFAFGVELLNLRLRAKAKQTPPVALHQPYR